LSAAGAGVALTVTGMLAARLWIESFNYFQHYGLIRVEGSRIGNRHVWNHMSELSRIVSFEITNHAGHHQDSYMPYNKLVPHAEAIPMPSLFTCFFVALIPPLWHRKIIMPALKRWDLEYATAEERALAREQNRRAKWPDWIGEGGRQGGQGRDCGLLIGTPRKERFGVQVRYGILLRLLALGDPLERERLMKDLRKAHRELRAFEGAADS
jgi:p-cymene monooxygenase